MEEQKERSRAALREQQARFLARLDVVRQLHSTSCLERNMFLFLLSSLRCYTYRQTCDIDVENSTSC